MSKVRKWDELAKSKLSEHSGTHVDNEIENCEYDDKDGMPEGKGERIVNEIDYEKS